MIEFAWDPVKDLMNQRKHGVSFEEAQTVFLDEKALLEYDEAHSLEEERFRLLGMSDRNNVLLVVHCVRNEDTIRIISARMTSTSERKEYERRAKQW